MASKHSIVFFVGLFVLRDHSFPNKIWPQSSQRDHNGHKDCYLLPTIHNFSTLILFVACYFYPNISNEEADAVSFDHGFFSSIKVPTRRLC